ncbi:MAG: DUF4340 domain-containing protein [Candidatus Jettenia sp. CY-1]|nr:MAG: DUF4340 domain-containing protein [Candidatus Jettenia sp. CY-1]
MKNKQILIAILVFLGLIAIYFTTRQGSERSSVIVGYQPVSKEFSTINVKKIELYKGSDSKHAVTLNRVTNGWEVESSFKVPGNNDKIQSILNTIVGIEGKQRATGKDFFEDFHLTDDKALHLVFTGKGSLPHVLIGKRGDDGRSTFIRLADKDAILIVDKDIYNEMGIWGDGNPKSEDWIEKQFLKLDEKQIQEIAYHLNGKDFLFKRQEKKTEKSKNNHEDNKNTENKETKDKEYEWKLVSWDKVFNVKESKIQDIASAASSLWIENAVDPAVYNNDLFKHTNTRITISTGDNKTHVIHLACKDDNVYIKKEGSSAVYKIALHEKKRIFPDAGRFLKIDLPKIKELEGYEVSDYRIDAGWAGKHNTVKESNDGDKTVKVVYALEGDTTRVCFNNDNTVFVFHKDLYEKLKSKE